MSGELATWQAKLPERSRNGIVQALRQSLEAAVRWGYISRNPAKLAGRNRQPAPRSVRAFTRAELDAIAEELSPTYAPLPTFAAATGLRPEEWRRLSVREVSPASALGPPPDETFGGREAAPVTTSGMEHIEQVRRLRPTQRLPWP